MGSNPLSRYLVGTVIVLTTCAASLHAASELNFPRIDFDTITGIAIVNPTPNDARVTLTAYGTDGQPVVANGFTNPAEIIVSAGQQISQVVEEIFGAKAAPETVVWIQAISPVNELTGFFLNLDAGITFFDGADLPTGDQRIVFPEVCFRPDCSTELNLVNLSDAARTVNLEIIGFDPPVVAEIDLPPRGVARFDASTLLPEGSSPAGQVAPETTYIVASSDGRIAGFEFVRRGDGDLLGLNAKPAAEVLNRIFFPQLAVLDPFLSQVTVINLGLAETLVTLRAFEPNGELYGPVHLATNPVTRALQPGERLTEDLETLFGFQGSETLSGWIVVESPSLGINGALSYTIPDINSVAAVASQAQGLTSAVFSHIATTAGFFTGIAVLNPGTLSANLRVVAVGRDGKVLGSYSTVLEPRHRIAKLIQEIIPASAGQAGGFILVRSNVPVFLTSLFGSLGSGVLANVPPQRIPALFRPDAAIPQLRVSPSLAVVAPGNSETFAIQGVTGEAQWFVNGIEGGEAGLGTINEGGQYVAPANMPATLPVTISGRVDEQIAGASVDVLTAQSLIQDLGTVQSIAYLDGLARLYSSEVFFGPAPSQTGGGVSSRVYDVTQGSQQVVSDFPNENISQIIPFQGLDGREYLLMAATVTGQILRLDPSDGSTTQVASDLDFPRSLVQDPTSGDLLVAIAGQVVGISLAELNIGLSSAAGNGKPTGLSPPAGVAFAGFDLVGIAVNPCNGNIVVADGEVNRLIEIDRLTGIQTVLSNSPFRHLLYALRSDVPCPQGAQLLAVDFAQNGISLYTGEEFIVWQPVAGDVSSLTALPALNPFGARDSILIATGSLSVSGEILLVETPGIYNPVAIPINPTTIPGLQPEFISFQFSGTVTNGAAFGFGVGTVASGRFFYDPTQAVQFQDLPTTATYGITNGAGIEVTIEGRTSLFRAIDSPPAGLVVLNDVPPGPAGLTGDAFVFSIGGTELTLSDSNQNIFNSTAIPTFLGSWPSASLTGGITLTLFDGTVGALTIDITNVQRIN